MTGVEGAEDRYSGKPFLRLVDAFVLKCIGHLDAASEAQLTTMNQKLRETFRSRGNWDDIVIEQLKFPSSIRTDILEVWQRNQRIAAENGVSLAPAQFVHMFVNDNVTSDI